MPVSMQIRVCSNDDLAVERVYAMVGVLYKAVRTPDLSRMRHRLCLSRMRH